MRRSPRRGPASGAGPGPPTRPPPAGLTYATVTKRREKGRVVEVGTRIVFGTVAAVLLALGMSKVSRAINTAFVERQNGDGPPPQRAEGAEDLSILEVVAASRGGHLPEPVLLQLLLARADADRHGRRGTPGETKPGHGGRADRSRLVDV